MSNLNMGETFLLPQVAILVGIIVPIASGGRSAEMAATKILTLYKILENSWITKPFLPWGGGGQIDPHFFSPFITAKRQGQSDWNFFVFSSLSVD